jgi:hypothetical protein
MDPGFSLHARKKRKPQLRILPTRQPETPYRRLQISAE